MSEDSAFKGSEEGLERFARYFESLPCYVTVQDRSLRVLDMNRAFREAFHAETADGVGESPDAPSGRRPLGERCYERYKGATAQCPQCPVEETFLREEPLQAEERLRTADGREFTAAVYTAPIRDSHGEIAQVLKVSADITDVKRLQKKLHDAQRRFQRLFDEVPCYITVQDRSLGVTAANRLFKEDFGDELGAPCYALYKHRTEPCLRCPVIRTFEDGRSHQSEEVVTSLGGEQIHVLVQTQPLRSDGGEITHVLEMSTNITELRRLQDQLTSLGLLVGSISHNLKGLITALDGGMYLLNTGFRRQDEGRVKEGWEIVKRNIGHIRSMVLDILHYAKERSLEWHEEEVAAFVEDVLGLMLPKASALEVELEHLVEPEAGRFVVDAGALRAALVNLLENALDACRVDMKKTEHRVHLEVSGSHEEVRFVIQDNGIGMDRETQERLFSLFFSSKGSEGTGLGLFISHKIIAQHGGSIEVTSSLDVGTRFTVRIPRERTP